MGKETSRWCDWKWLLGAAGTIAAVAAGAGYKVGNAVASDERGALARDVAAAEARAAFAEREREAAEREREAARADTAACRRELSLCDQRRVSLEAALAACRGVSCEIPTIRLTPSDTDVGKPNRINVVLHGASTLGATRLFAAVRVEDERGGRSWWASDVLAHRDGQQEVTVYLGRQRPGMRLVPVVIRETRAGTVVTNRALTRAGTDFEELCAMAVQ